MNRKRLAIVGGGSSGLVCLKYALDTLPDWEVVCYEKSSEITGCWGNPPAGFVSTSTKYTTQFACHRKFDATVTRDANASDRRARYSDFFVDDEYGRYLESFAEAFQLHSRIIRNCSVSRIERGEDGVCRLHLDQCGEYTTEEFSAVVICTGLANTVRPLDCGIETLRSIDSRRPVTGKKIVVIGGGESGVDLADRLSKPELDNEVYLSLRTGIRVSPRYHPIRGVPSDFLRNRLMLSIHQDIRNSIGQKFVEFRMRSQEVLERLFPSRARRAEVIKDEPVAKRKYWSLKLTQTAKDRLFNMFHNKSDDFLDSVAEERITIIGRNVDDSYTKFFAFDDNSQTIAVKPDLIVPAIGFRSNLEELSGGQLALKDFYLSCSHVEYDNVFLIGFTRPIIGNIPSISEMQARYICSQISKQVPRPPDIRQQHDARRAELKRGHPGIDIDQVYPVEMFPYCDELARQMGCYPSLKRVRSFLRWVRIMLSPSTTMHYFDGNGVNGQTAKEPIHAPLLITLFLLVIKVFDCGYRLVWRPIRGADQ